MPHNHPPRCCCEFKDAAQYDGEDLLVSRCSSCVIHGELAQLADNECPSCHQLPHRPPTDYCQRPDWHTTCRTLDVDGEPVRIQGSGGRISPEAANAISTVVRATRDAMAQTTQPATRTTTPPTHTRAEQPRGNFPPRFCGSDAPHPRHNWWTRNDAYACPGEPTPLATPTPPAREALCTLVAGYHAAHTWPHPEHGPVTCPGRDLNGTPNP